MAKYEMVAPNIDLIEEPKRSAYCRSCAVKKGQKTPLDPSKSILVKMRNREAYAIIGPCLKCGRKRCCYVKRPSGLLVKSGENHDRRTGVSGRVGAEDKFRLEDDGAPGAAQGDAVEDVRN